MRRVRPVMANGRLSRTYAARSISWFPSTTQIWCTKCGTTPKILKFPSGNFAGVPLTELSLFGGILFPDP